MSINNLTQEVVLRDVLGSSLEEYSPNITVGLAVTTVNAYSIDDGIVVFTKCPKGTIDSDYRVVLENAEGKLILHVWATEDSIKADPTHSIEIEVSDE